MEMLIPIVLLLFILGFALRFLLGERIFEHVAGKFVYDLLRWIIFAPFRIVSRLLKLTKF